MRERKEKKKLIFRTKVGQEMGHFRHNLAKLPQLELAKVQGYQNFFRKLAKIPHLEPVIFQELLKLISLSLTLIQENGKEIGDLEDGNSGISITFL